MNLLFKDRKKREKESKLEREREFLKNGGILLELLVSLCDGRPPPIRNFSYQELIRATDNFDPTHLLFSKDLDVWYRGFHDGRSITIKKYENLAAPEHRMFPFIDIATLAKMSAHKNVLKLIGCCLDTPMPILVTESIANANLSNRIMSPQGEPMALQSRLKIGREIAHAIAYLHTAFRRPIIHRDIRLRNVAFDHHGVPKLSNFALSISLPEGETQVRDDVRGTIGFICPKYINTGWITEKVDVYSFGVILLELITAKHPYELDHDAEDIALKKLMKKKDMMMIVDPAILAEEGGAIVDHQLQAVFQLALICVDDDPEKRPTMVDVTKQLRQIEKFVV